MNTEVLSVLGICVVLCAVGAVLGASMVLRRTRLHLASIEAQLGAQSSVHDAGMRTLLRRLNEGLPLASQQEAGIDFLCELRASLRESQESAAASAHELARLQADHQAQLFAAHAEEIESLLARLAPSIGKEIASELNRAPPAPSAPAYGLLDGPGLHELANGIAELAIAQFDQHHLAVNQKLDHAQAQVVERMDQAAHETFQRAAQMLRQAMQVEFDFMDRQQLERQEAFNAQQARRHAEQLAQGDLLAGDLRAVMHALALRPGRRAEPPATRPEAVGTPASVSQRPTPSHSLAHPPELQHTPLPRPEPAADLEAPEPELSDEELDALPPELPSADRPRRRILPAPKKPPLSSL